MVDALREAHRVLQPQGVLIDERPLVADMAVEVVLGPCALWTVKVVSCSTPGDIETADAAVRHALAAGWFAPEKSNAFDFEAYCDTTAELQTYVKSRKLLEAEIPYRELEERQKQSAAARLRCRRHWMLKTFRRC
jgi:hypothetical protein